MKVINFFLLFSLLFFILPISIAHHDFNEISIVLDVSEDRVTSAEYTIVISEVFDGEFEIPLFSEVQGIVLYDKKTLEQIEFTKDEDLIHFDTSIESGETKVIIINAYFSDIVSESNGKKVIQLTQPTIETELLEFTIKLPQGYVVSELDEKQLVIPEPNNLLSDGKSIILNWREDNPTEDFEAFVTYEPTKQGLPWTYIFFTLLILLGAFLLIISITLKSKSREKRIVTVGLSEDEKKIYDIIREKGEVNQKEVQHELEFSKPRLSKLIRNLVQAEMIEKKPLGRTNILKIKKL